MDVLYLGNCTNERLVIEIFGSVTNFAHEVEAKGNEFMYNDGSRMVTVEYDDCTDIHRFYVE